MTYIPGNFYRICDRCGFRYRASETRMTWDGLYVCMPDFETRHPQDFVRGRKDNQNVPGPRPDSIGPIIGPLTTSTTAAALPGATTFNVISSVRFLAADHIGATGSDGNMMSLTILSIPTPTSIQVTAPLRLGIPEGAIVINYSAVSQPDIG